MVAIVMKLVRVVAHPVAAHGVDGCGQCESGQIHFTVKQCHNVRDVPACEWFFLVGGG